MSDALSAEEGREVGAPPGDPLWEDWDSSPRMPGMPVLHLDGFDGPMDLLLDLAERQRIDFGRMSVLDLAGQFVAAMDRLVGRVPLERRADWLTARPQLGIDVFARPPAVPASREGGYVALMEACLVVLQGRGGKPVEKPVYQPVIPDV